MEDCTGVRPSPGTGTTGNCNRHMMVPPWGGQTQRRVPGYIARYIPACLTGQDLNGLLVNAINQYQVKAPLTVPRAGSCSKQRNNYV